MTTRTGDHFNLLCDIGDLATLLTGTGDITAFLQQSVEMVASALQVPVCSIYLFDDTDESLVLKATTGLNPDSVGRVRMKLGEGLVGLCMEQLRPVREGDAFRSSHFKYFKIAGEDPYASFLGVPMRRGRERIGVLAVQHTDRDAFDSVDVRALRALASQLAGPVENARLLISLHAREALEEERTEEALPAFFKGRPASPGWALARALVLEKNRDFLTTGYADPEIAWTAEDFETAVRITGEQLKELQEKFSERLPESASLIFTTHFMMLKDRKFLDKIREGMGRGLTPPQAVRAVARHYVSVFQASPNEYIREKATDLEDLASRLLANLLNRSEPLTGRAGERIVVARELYPSELLKLVSDNVRGIVLVSGGVSSHVAILARSLRIPLLIAEEPVLLTLRPETRLLLDCEAGTLITDPSNEVLERFQSRISTQESVESRAEEMREQTITADGTRVRLMANINLLTQIDLALQLKAEGIGLYRTEFPFLIRSAFPSETEQFLIYDRLCRSMQDKPVTIRTLDIGGDKLLPSSHLAGERNPELGLRSIRFSMRHPHLFEVQLRAILRAGVDTKKLRIMFPMISSVDEFRSARAMVMDCIAALREEGVPCRENPAIGMMVELPAVLETMEEFAREAHFFSIGSNDFIQYLLAADRTNSDVETYYEARHPAVLRGLARIVSTARSFNREVSICGDLAGSDSFLPFLLGIGLRSLSLDPQFLPAVQRRIEELDTGQCAAFAREALEQTTIAGAVDVFTRFNASGSRGGDSWT